MSNLASRSPGPPWWIRRTRRAPPQCAAPECSVLLFIRAADRRSAAARRALVSRELVLLYIPLTLFAARWSRLHAAASAHGLAVSSGAGSAPGAHPTNHAAYAAACSRNGGTAATASTSPPPAVRTATTLLAAPVRTRRPQPHSPTRRTRVADGVRPTRGPHCHLARRTRTRRPQPHSPHSLALPPPSAPPADRTPLLPPLSPCGRTRFGALPPLAT